MRTDVIVIGGGSAGCVAAARLSEDPARQVLLLEAGPGSGGLWSRIPAAFNRLFRGPFDWAYETEPEPRMAGRRLFWPRGRMLGGSSAMNAMVWTRGHPSDFDGWAQRGCTGWSWREVRPWFDRLALVPEVPRVHNPVTDAFLEAVTSLGEARNDGFARDELGGAGYFATSIRAGERNSAERACLRPARKRSNLRVRTGVAVDRVVFDGHRATGVVVRSGRNAETIRAGAVVLAAGAIGSPSILLRSGIGPADELRRVGIDVVAESPGVGRNLSDHLAIAVACRCREPVTLEGARGIGPLLQWLVLKRGPLTSNIAEAGAFVRTRAGLPAPDLELLVGPAWFVDHGFRRMEGHGFVIAAVGLNPQSRGRLRLRGPSVDDPPLIEANYLDDPADLATLVEGMRRVRAVAATAAFDRFRGEEVLPGPEVQSDEALSDYVRREAQTLYHPAGTCRMGTDGDAVVDPSLRLRSVSNVWVVDASVMPTPVSAHPNAAVMMIGERGADFVGRTD